MKQFSNYFKCSVMALACLLFLSNTSIAQNTPKLTDPQIASAAVTANQIDVNYGKIALQRSKNERIRMFAETMINDHENIINMAAALAKKLNVTPQTNAVTQSLLDGEKEMTKKLNSLKGKAFDKAYAQNEYDYHKAVVGAVKTVLIPQTQNAELKGLLQKVVPLLESHEEMAQRLSAHFN